MDVEQPGGANDLVIRPTRATAQRAAVPPPTSGQAQQRGLFGNMFGKGGQDPEPAVCLCRENKTFVWGWFTCGVGGSLMILFLIVFGLVWGLIFCGCFLVLYMMAVLFFVLAIGIRAS